MTNPFKQIQKWWDGHPYENDTNSQVVFFCMVYPRPRIYWDNFKEHLKMHWQFWISILAGGIFTLIGLMK